jgi:hypothetical protein
MKTQKVDVERFSLQELKDVDVCGQYQRKVFQLWGSYVAADTKMWFRKALRILISQGNRMWVSMKGSCFGEKC